MICEFWDQNRMCACFRTEDGKPAPGPDPAPQEQLPQAIPDQSGQPPPDADKSGQRNPPQDQSGQGNPPQDQAGSQPAIDPVDSVPDQPAPAQTEGEIPVVDPSMNAVPPGSDQP